MSTDPVKELEAVNAELASLSYSIAHDVRSPLRAIDGFSEMLMEDYAGKLDDQGVDYLRRIRSAVARMELLIGCLNDLARVSREDMHIERVNLSEIAERIAERLQKLEPDRRVEFTIAPGLVVDGDARLLATAFEQLLANAWKFTSKRATAKIEVGRSPQAGEIFVRDDGAGFDPAYAGRLFTPFQRLHAASEFEGIGIGLALVRRIVRRHHGDVRATGGLGSGATVFVELG